MSGSSKDGITIKIHVKTAIVHEGNQEVFELTTFGMYYKKEESFFLQYEEISEEGAIKTIVKISGEEALILRSGSVKMRMPFKLHEELGGHYETPFGTLQTAALTKELTYEEMNNGTGSAGLIYDLTMQGSPAGTYTLKITFKEEKQ